MAGKTEVASAAGRNIIDLITIKLYCTELSQRKLVGEGGEIKGEMK